MSATIYEAICQLIDAHLRASGVRFKRCFTQYQSGGMFGSPSADCVWKSAEGAREFLLPRSAVMRDFDERNLCDPEAWATRIQQHIAPGAVR